MCSKCVAKETKQIHTKAFNVITNTDEAKKVASIFHVIVNASSIVKNVIHLKNGIKKHVTVNVKIITSAKKIIVGILAHVFVIIANI